MKSTARNNKKYFIIFFAVLFCGLTLTLQTTNTKLVSAQEEVQQNEELTQDLETANQTNQEQELQQNNEAQDNVQNLENTENPEISTTSATENDEQIFRKEQNKQKLEELAKLYRAQIEVYRNAERTFSISKSQYEKIQTLASLEQAVNDTRTAMLERNRVLLTYAEIIYYSVDDATGIDLAKKQILLEKLEELIDNFRLHQQKVENSKDRVAVNDVANEFILIEADYQNVIYDALSSIRVGRIQTVYDALILISDDIKREQQKEEVGALQTSQRERAYQEIQNKFKVIYDALYVVNMKLTNSEDVVFSRSSYQNTLSSLQSVYANLFLMIDYLLEVRKL